MMITAHSKPCEIGGAASGGGGITISCAGGAGGMLICGGGTCSTTTGGFSTTGTATEKLAMADQPPTIGAIALTLQK